MLADMNSTTAPTGVASRRLERPHDGRMLSGAAVGIARHVNVDPILIRLGFIVGVFAGGFGIVAYLAAWLLIPEEGRERPMLHTDSGGRVAVVTGVVLIVIGALAAADEIFGGWGGDLVWCAALVGG